MLLYEKCIKCINVINMNILTHSLVVQCIFLYFPYIKSQFLIRNIIVLIQLFSMSQNICLLLFSDLLPPKLTVNPPVITETDSVTLNCQTPPSVSVSQCYFYTVSGGTVRGFSCLQTLTGTELLKMSHQSSPAEVEVKCYYTVKIGELKSQSPNSNISTVFIHNLLPPKLTVNPPLITETDSVTLNCQTPPSFSVSQCYFYTVSGGTVRSFSCLQTLTGTELLKMSHQSSPAEVEVKCYYIVKVGELNSPYLHSNISTVSIHTLLPPELTVTPLLITETDSVTLNCQTPPSFSVSQCYFYTVSGGTVRVFSCIKTLTGTELLKMSHQSSPAEVEVKCYYIVKVGELKSQSPHSKTSSITIHNIVEGESSMTQTMPTYSVTKDIVKKGSSMTQTMPTFTVTKGWTVKMSGASVKLTSGWPVGTSDNTGCSTSPTPVKPASDIVEKESSMTQTMPTFTVTKGWTVKMSGASVKLTSGWPVATSSNTGCSTSLTPVKPASAGTWIWKSGVVVTACGVITGTIMLLAICCNKRRAAGPEEVKEQEPQNENGDTYHMYCTISEEPATFALKDMMYSTVQKH
ncbi:uncharacterized protein LOC127372542 isoform X3 [Dicentrarchus labrax]|uniref:uncharacterized protein LOC127372542 isoform X3 n=1 Tax=Dicentrarchus labrax TaxID=13489 RepID=UPI0021F50E5B|nr:uncharacterized protein LOC127372542 isoform X3 [Dicentrarchus labrax]